MIDWFIDAWRVLFPHIPTTKEKEERRKKNAQNAIKIRNH